VVQTTTAVMAGIGEKQLHEFLGTLGRVRDAIAAVPEDLGPPAPRQTPRNLRRS